MARLGNPESSSMLTFALSFPINRTCVNRVDGSFKYADGPVIFVDDSCCWIDFFFFFWGEIENREVDFGLRMKRSSKLLNWLIRS